VSTAHSHVTEVALTGIDVKTFKQKLKKTLKNVKTVAKIKKKQTFVNVE